MNIATGYMESSVMRHRARATGLVGMEPPLSNCALVACCITKLLIVVIGRRFVCFPRKGFPVSDLFRKFFIAAYIEEAFLFFSKNFEENDKILLKLHHEKNIKIKNFR